MKSEVIYKHSSSWYGRYGEECGRDTVICSDFDDPTVWPYTVKQTEYEIPEDEDEEREENEVSHRISKEVFEDIKNVIENNSALCDCDDHIENSVMDGEDDSFDFNCDAFSKFICGLSILSCGSYDIEHDHKTDNAIVAKAVREIEAVLEQAGINIKL